ncbi:hypothetical protein L486_08107 [Kwoniella mangroviensis CBS 10435]|uniref:Uncharacterized protein n=1 Tax=Kwoniella mangroviensis CBS 10435 TaxID=1331196 RepID=A0A1B9IG61_9TREE|nr:hypothetical protein L486_08107 [Kwoniella mangroviensis CBS 10435]
MPKDSSGAGVRVSWSPELTLKLLKFLQGEKYYRQVFFPRSSTLPKDRHLYARAAVMEFFENDEWMRDAERRGLANWNASEKEWRPTTEWGSNISNPINCRVNLLKQRMSDRYYKKKYQIADSCTSFDDIPSASKRATFRKLHPYYFILKELCERGEKKCRAEALELRDLPKADPGKGQRRKRSNSISSASSYVNSASDLSSDSDSSAAESSGQYDRPTTLPTKKAKIDSSTVSSLGGCQPSFNSTKHEPEEEAVCAVILHTKPDVQHPTNRLLFTPRTTSAEKKNGYSADTGSDSSTNQSSSIVVPSSPPPGIFQRSNKRIAMKQEFNERDTSRNLCSDAKEDSSDNEDVDNPYTELVNSVLAAWPAKEPFALTKLYQTAFVRTSFRSEFSHYQYYEIKIRPAADKSQP